MRKILAIALTMFAVHWSDPSSSRAAPEDLRKQVKGNESPLVRLNVGGPLAHIAAVEFSADGNSIYAAGWDKVVHVWDRRSDGEFQARPDKAIRIPIGPDEHGKINAIAISPDNRWLAIGGVGLIREGSGYNDRFNGLVLPTEALTSEQWLDYGTIYLFDRQQGQFRQTVRACRGVVQALRFVKGPEFQAEWSLVAAAREGDVRRLYLVDSALGIRHQTELPLPAPENRIPPTLTSWFTSPQAASLRVGLTWGDGNFRVWEPLTGKRPTADACEAWFTCMYEPGMKRVLVGTRGEVLVGDRFGNATGQTVLSRVVGDQGIPRSMAVLGQNGRHLAIVVTRNTNGRENENSLLTVRSDNWTTVREVAISRGSPPPLAVSASGEYLALFDNETRQLLLHHSAKLIDPAQSPQPQVLDSPTRLLWNVAFATRDDHLGLLLRERETLPTDDLVLDLSDGAISKNPDWLPVAHKIDQWQIQPEGGSRLNVQRPDGVRARVELPPDTLIDGWTLCPLTKPVPLLAVAVHRHGEPQLRIFNANNGEWLRMLRGPLERIHSLAFSPDGRLLAAAAADGRISVWWLADLEQTLGSQGMLRGLRVGNDEAGQLVVKAIDATHFPTARTQFESLQVGNMLEAVKIDGVRHELLRSPLEVDVDDVLEAMEIDGVRYKVTLAKDFYRMIARQPSGDSVKLFVRGRREPLSLELGAAVDSRNEHFTVYFERSARTRRWSWMAWSPLGVYTSSDREIERSAGWHFNTTDPTQPVKFASLDQYPRLYRDALLNYLLDHETPLLEPPRLEPEMSLHFQHQGNAIFPDPEGRIFLPPGQEIVVNLLVTQVPAAIVESVHFVAANGKELQLERSDRDAGIWERRILLPERKQPTSLSVVVRTRGSYRQQFRLESSPIVVQPRPRDLPIAVIPPKVEIRDESPPQIVQLAPSQEAEDQPHCSLQCRVRSESKPVRVFLSGTLPAESRPVSFEQLRDDIWEARIDKVALELGANKLQMKVENAAGWSQPATIIVHRQAAPVASPPPVVELDSEREVVSRSSPFLMKVRVTTSAPLAELVYTLNEHDHMVATEHGRPDGNDLVFDLPLELVPDRINNFSVVARDQQGQVSEPRQVHLTFVPAPIEITILKLADADNRTLEPVRGAEGTFEVSQPVGTSSVLLSGVLDAHGEGGLPESIYLKAWVNGFLQTAAVQWQPRRQENRREFTAKLTLTRAQDNRILFELAPGSHPYIWAQVRIATCELPDTSQELHVLVVNVGEEDLKEKLQKQMSVFRQGARGIDFVETLSKPEISPDDMNYQLQQYRLRVNGSDAKNHALLFYFHGPVVETANNNFALLTRSNAVAVDKDNAMRSESLEDHLAETGGAHLVFLDTTTSAAKGQQEKWPTHSRLGVVRASWTQRDPIPIEDRILARIAEAVGTKPITFAGLSGQLEKLYANHKNTQFESHIPPTGVDVLVLIK